MEITTCNHSTSSVGRTVDSTFEDVDSCFSFLPYLIAVPKSLFGLEYFGEMLYKQEDNLESLFNIENAFPGPFAM